MAAVLKHLLNSTADVFCANRCKWQGVLSCDKEKKNCPVFDYVKEMVK